MSASLQHQENGSTFLPIAIRSQIKTMKAEDLLDALDRASGENVIPFKPKTKKANGGTVPPLKGPASDGMGSLFRRK